MSNECGQVAQVSLSPLAPQVCVFVSRLYVLGSPDALNFTILLVTNVHLSVPAGVQLTRQQRSTSVDTRNHCQTFQTCHFYSHCIESKFPCGSEGFMISYAKERCHVINKLRAYGVGKPARNWARDSETCFQDKLEKLLEKYPTHRNPDPQTCLAWEEDAIKEMNACYTEGPLKDQLFGLPDRDVQKMIQLFRVGGDYYNATVDTGLLSIVGSMRPDLTASLQSDSTSSMLNRIILCVQARKYPDGLGEDYIDPTPDEIVDIVSSQLDQHRPESFFYAGPDQFEDFETPSGLCFNHSIDVNAHTNDYHLVTWFTPNANRRVIGKTSIMYNREIVANALVFELTSTRNNSIHRREVTRCGDGIRQVSESCDYASNYPSCTIDCRVRSGHDCTIGKLEPSACWMEVCGDGRKTLGEDCDDGNNNDGDGCNRVCKLDSTSNYKCTTAYNGTSECAALPVEMPQQGHAKLIAQESSVIVDHSSSLSGESNQRTVESAASGCRAIRHSMLWWVLGLLSVCILTLR